MCVVSWQTSNAPTNGPRNVTSDLKVIALAQTSLQHAVEAVRDFAISNHSHDLIQAQINQVANSSSQLYATMADYFVRTLGGNESDPMARDLQNNNNREAMDQTVKQMDGNTKSVCELTLTFATAEKREDSFDHE